jgi:hypothetical protein
MPITSRLVKFTPAMATKMLEGNVLNRKIKDKLVKFYADQMKRNMWLQDGSTLKFAADGTLLDGQHRLWACIEANVPFTSLVAENVDKNTFVVIDTGAGRTPGDVIDIAGHKQHSSVIASAALHIMNYRTADVNSFKKRRSRQDVLAFVQDNEELVEFCTLARCIKSVMRKQASVAIAISFLASKRYPQQSRNFLHKFMSGEDLNAKSPILVLRNRLLGERLLRPVERLSLTANAWNAYIAGRQVSTLKVITLLPKITGA